MRFLNQKKLKKRMKYTVLKTEYFLWHRLRNKYAPIRTPVAFVMGLILGIIFHLFKLPHQRKYVF